MKPVNIMYEYLEIPGDLPIKKRNYFKVVAKCGHVGKGYYFEGKFYVMAQTATRAAEKTRKFPRVKHDYKDAIISVEPISYQEYLEGQNYEYNRPYYNCLSKQEQLMNWDDISRDIHYEDDNDGRWQMSLSHNSIGMDLLSVTSVVVFIPRRICSSCSGRS